MKDITKLHLCVEQGKEYPWKVKDQNERIVSEHTTSKYAEMRKQELEFMLGLK